VTLASSAWPHRLAVLTAAATLVLIVAGGLVTNTGAALAVPDWPTTFGHNMFLFPWSGMVGGVFFEHSHRLLGALVGLLTLGLALALWLGEPRRWVRGLGLLAAVLVVAQGVLGGLRVLWLRDTLAIVHGCVAQAFFALVVAIAVVTSRAWLVPAPGRAGDGGTWRLALAATAALYGQIVLGALTTHAGWVNLHLAGAAVAVVLVTALAGRLLAWHGGEPALARPAALLAVLVVLQVAVGLGAYVGRFTGLAVPGGAVVTLALPVTHRVTASLLLGLGVTLALRTGRQQAAGGRRVALGGGLASREVAA
jgi:cytochrome c oxidase assembly protein subunit 15